ncbi:putative mitochondrial protein [Cucumis melo var. makuwa]|uniref:Mitochondrial protein n=1 Tax=Cucumis melo var. makuwa TaxID=1194695 RepID=A0A5A7TPC4_CUCMM|nr:putative mitochondrial protein [Cucumis melo var. makuwa]TYK29329.1 putative mitochondrial protein [Cucumis melo var. makuwa]
MEVETLTSQPAPVQDSEPSRDKTPVEFKFYASSLRGTHGSCQQSPEILENDTWKSTSGYYKLVLGNLVTWRSKKQSVVTKSSAEAKYRAMSLGICKEIWLQKVLIKYVEIDQHFIKEGLDNGSIRILYIPSSQQIADVLTKGLLRPNFDFCVVDVLNMLLFDISIPT